MVYESGHMRLEVIGELQKTKVNEVLVCRNRQEEGVRSYLLWRIKDHEVSKKIVKDLYQEGRPQCFLECFTRGQETFFVFPYDQPRPILRFLKVDADKTENQVALYQRLILECSASSLPAPLLYQVLEQNQVHIKAQGEISFQMNLDLSRWSRKQEDACVQACAGLLMRCLEQEGQKAEKNIYGLLEKKTLHNSYRSFRELYQDICLMGRPEEKMKDIHPVLNQGKKKILFRILLWICGFLAFGALVIFVSQLVFGDIPLLRLFHNGFEQIGTESLLQ